MQKIKKKSSITFILEFTTSKLLSYIVVLITSIIGYLLTSPDVVIIGIMAGAALSGAKSVSDNIMKMKGKGLIKDSEKNETEEDVENGKGAEIN